MVDTQAGSQMCDRFNEEARVNHASNLPVGSFIFFFCLKSPLQIHTQFQMY
ncbi:hypothetical protein [uncultured Nostoc sp.]|uniref:hypothetical protein n=1 Tax=uncultured Nostoc sp. TaxID=340711 RepID=UPI0035CC12AD